MLRKRAIISMIVTIIVIILTNKYWLIFKPMQVSFDIKGNGTCNIETILNKKDDDSFSKFKSQKTEVNLEQVNHVDVYVKRSRFPKRVKFNISGLKTEENICLSNLIIGNFNINDLEKFKVDGAIPTVYDNQLILKPNNINVTLTYPETLHVRTVIKFDFKIFVVILVLTYLLAYKFANYVSEFKTVENKSRSDIIFLIIFFIFLFLPMSHINQNEISIQENRTLTKWQPLLKENYEINFNFGKDFNEWFNDRFNLRHFMISSNYFLKKNLCYEYCDFGDIHYNKKTHWAINDFWLKFPYIQDDEINIMKQKIKKLDDFCSKNNIKLYLLIVPAASQIYPEAALPVIIQEYDSAERFKSQVNDYLKKEVVVYPIKELKEASKLDYVYPKSDPHYTEYGTFVAFNTLMKRIKKDFKNVRIPQESDYNIIDKALIRTDWGGAYWLGFFYYSIKINHLFDNYATYINKNEDKLKIVNRNEELLYEDTYFPYGNDLNAYLIGTSFVENLNLFAKYTFKHNYKKCASRDSGKLEMKRWEDDIINSNTDVLIIVLQAPAIYLIDQLYETVEK